MKNRIKELREQKHLTQEELAKKINVTKLTISNWENGKHKIKSDELKEIAKVFGVTIDYLVGDVDVNRIKKLRENNGITQKFLAEIVGVNIRTLQHYEKGDTVPRLHKAQIIADYFGVSVPYLLGYVDENENIKHDSNFVQITISEFDDLWNARQELNDLKIALRIIKNAMGFATNEEIEVKDDK